jgi:pimeloyl-ACP methyl ester carboxylesterase
VISAVMRRARFLRRRFEMRRPKGARDPVSVSLDMASDSRTLLLAFGGMQGRIGMPPFEFLRLTGEMPVKRLFVRDVRQAWYHRGTPEYGGTIADVAHGLRELLDTHDVQRFVTAGSSAGGYAALLFGTLLGADAVLCFSPQTTLELAAMHEIGDHRWDDRLVPLVEAGALDLRWADLASALPHARRADTRYQVYFDDSLEVDRRHAERLVGLEGLRLYRFGSGSHHLVRALRDAGALERILQAALDVPPGPGDMARPGPGSAPRANDVS